MVQIELASFACNFASDGASRLLGFCLDGEIVPLY